MFISHGIRDKILAASKMRRLTTSDFGFEHSAPIYVNEHLCPRGQSATMEGGSKEEWEQVEISVGIPGNNTNAKG